MEMDWPYTQNESQSKGTGMESLGQETVGERSGGTWSEIKQLALNREEWEKLVSGLYTLTCHSDLTQNLKESEKKI